MSLEAYKEYLDKISLVEIPNYLKNTFETYNQFVLTRLSASNAGSFTMRTSIKQFVLAFSTFKSFLKSEINLLKDVEIEKILDRNNFPKRHKMIFILFLMYCQSKLKCCYEKKYNATRGDYSKESDIYSPEELLDYYKYVNDVELHLQDALQSKYYASTWLYIMMHLIDAWRKSDIVFGLTRINIEVIGVHSIEWFNSNRITRDQAREITNQVANSVEKMYIQKTGALGHFLVNEDMLISCATALVITELHRNIDDSLLLKSLVGYGKSVNIPKKFFLIPFFKHRPDLVNFQSRKANRTLLTYFFYSVTDSSRNSDIAYNLTQRLRGHVHPDSTAVYIQATNKDGSLDRVSLNLFNRGHFGWLYNFIVMLSDESHQTHTIEQRTALIQSYKSSFTPIQFESLSSFLQQQQQEKQSIALRLSNMPKDELKIILQKIYRGEMPSRLKNGQCLLYPNCPIPSVNSCSHCNYLIPKVYLLSSIEEEIKRLLHSIKTTRYRAIRERDSSLLYKILDLLNQAVAEFGKTYVQVFIDIDTLKKSLLTVADKLLQPKAGEE